MAVNHAATWLAAHPHMSHLGPAASHDHYLQNDGDAAHYPGGSKGKWFHDHKKAKEAHKAAVASSSGFAADAAAANGGAHTAIETPAAAKPDTGWVTMHGAKVHFGTDGKIDIGPAHMMGSSAAEIAHPPPPVAPGAPATHEQANGGVGTPTTHQSAASWLAAHPDQAHLGTTAAFDHYLKHGGDHGPYEKKGAQGKWFHDLKKAKASSATSAAPAPVAPAPEPAASDNKWPWGAFEAAPVGAFFTNGFVKVVKTGPNAWDATTVGSSGTPLQMEDTEALAFIESKTNGLVLNTVKTPAAPAPAPSVTPAADDASVDDIMSLIFPSKTAPVPAPTAQQAKPSPSLTPYEFLKSKGSNAFLLSNSEALKAYMAAGGHAYASPAGKWFHDLKAAKAAVLADKPAPKYTPPKPPPLPSSAVSAAPSPPTGAGTKAKTGPALTGVHDIKAAIAAAKQGVAHEIVATATLWGSYSGHRTPMQLRAESGVTAAELDAARAAPSMQTAKTAGAALAPKRGPPGLNHANPAPAPIPGYGATTPEDVDLIPVVKNGTGTVIFNDGSEVEATFGLAGGVRTTGLTAEQFMPIRMSQLTSSTAAAWSTAAAEWNKYGGGATVPTNPPWTPQTVASGKAAAKYLPFVTPAHAIQNGQHNVAMAFGTDCHKKAAAAANGVWPPQGTSIGLTSYTGSAHAAANEDLRTGRKMSGHYASMTRKADKACNTSRMVKDVVLWRGTNHHPQLDQLLAKLPLDQVVGATISDAGFQSASTMEATSFTGRKYSLVIEAPAGTKGAYVGLASGGYATISSASAEYEVILPRNTSMRITAIERSTTQGQYLEGGATIMVRAVIVHQEDTATQLAAEI